MNSIITEYLGYLERMCGFADRTLNKHQRILKVWKKFLASNKDKNLLQAEPADLLAFIGFRQKAGKVKNTTISGELCVLRTLYTYLFDFGKLSSNPAAALPELICEPPGEKTYLTIDECFELLRSIDMNDPIGLRDYTIVALLWSAGLRSGELCALNWRDIDLKQGALLVRMGKGGKQRQVFLNDRVCQDLIRYRRRMGGRENSPLFYAFSKNASNTKKYARLSQSRLVEIIRMHGRKAEIKKAINPLTFRHTFATHMYEAGVSMQDIKEMLGHDDETETTIYVHISIDTAKRFLKDHVSNPLKY